MMYTDTVSQSIYSITYILYTYNMYMYYIVILYTSSYIAVLLCVYMQVKPVMVIAKNPRSDIQFYDANQPVSSLRGMVVITS